MGVFSDYASKYFESGLSIIPLNGKVPLIKGWEKFSEEMPTAELIDAWCVDYPDANIGLVCGAASGIIAFDFDYEGSDQGKVEDILLQLLPPSPVRKCGKKKWTAFYRYNGIGSTYFQRGKLRLADFLSSNKQTVIPPSIHPDTGDAYRWITEATLLDVNAIDLPVIDASILEKIDMLKDFDFNSKDNPFSERNGRHDTVVSYALAVIEKCASVEDLANRMMEYDAKKFPGEEYFKDTKYFKHKDPKRECLRIAKALSNFVEKAKAKRGVEWKIGQRVAGSAEPVECFYEIVTDEEGKERQVPQYTAMADHYKEKKLFVSSKTGDWKFSSGYWKPFEDLGLCNEIFKHNHAFLRPAHLDNFRKMIRARCFKDAFGFKETDGLININNGILKIDEGKILPLSNEYFFKYKIPISYEAKAVCPNWLEFLNFVLSGDAELINACQKIFGYCMLGGTPFLHKAFVLHGSGRNGKSVFLDVLRNIIGFENTTSVSLANIDKPFSVVQMDGKLANIVEETPNGEINSEIFKAIIGGGFVTAARKGFDEYSLRVNARFVFACNDMPIFKDKNESMLDRLLFIPFKVYIEEKNRDTNIYAKFVPEYPGILNWAIEGAKMVLADRNIETTKASALLKEEYRKETDPFYAWFDDCIEIDPILSSGITTANLYKFYKNDMEENGNYALTQQNFSKRFKKMLLKKCAKLGFVPDFEMRIRTNHGQVRGFNFVKYDFNATGYNKTFQPFHNL